MEVITVPLFSDNYSYLVVDTETRDTAAVDPADGSAILRELGERKLHLKYILTTHHHMDHSGGNLEILSKSKGVEVVCGSKGEKVPGCSLKMTEGQSITLGTDVEISLFDTPCHTKDSVSFLAKDKISKHQSLFTGYSLISPSLLSKNISCFMWSSILTVGV
jgi:hydroxyacylglutathione hydrolase